MAIIILRKPNKEHDRKPRYHITCLHCGCEFQCNREDFDRYAHTYAEKCMIKCPCCGEPIEFFADCCRKSDHNDLRGGNN